LDDTNHKNSYMIAYFKCQSLSHNEMVELIDHPGLEICTKLLQSPCVSHHCLSRVQCAIKKVGNRNKKVFLRGGGGSNRDVVSTQKD
jgi:hypothetical protein